MESENASAVEAKRDSLSHINSEGLRKRIIKKQINLEPRNENALIHSVIQIAQKSLLLKRVIIF